jgi:hypothetical protein
LEVTPEPLVDDLLDRQWPVASEITAPQKEADPASLLGSIGAGANSRLVGFFVPAFREAIQLFPRLRAGDVDL